MKKLNILYWIFTGLFAALMLFSAIPDIVATPEAMEIVNKQLHYPEYFVQFIGVAKLLGVIAILIPGWPRVKEWAYAGLFFDLIGAVYSALMSGPFDPALLGMLIFIIPGILSYIYYHKRLKAKQQ